MDSNSLFCVGLIVFIALVFDFINGFHDAANSIATIVSTRVLKPQHAVVWAAFFNFLAAFLIGTQVATTIGTGIIKPAFINNFIILAALGSAIVWNLATWWLGLPSSSSHALIGGLMGAGIVRAGFDALVWSGIVKTAAFIVLSPAIGLALGFFLMVLIMNLYVQGSVSKAGMIFRRSQLFSAAIYSLSYGMNDAQKTIGIIAMVLFSSGYLGSEFYIPYWTIILCYIVIAAGTMSGGWRIVKTMGMSITKLDPMGGFCAQSAAAISIIGASLGGIPVSTTHTITGAIVGVGTTKRLTAVRWGIAGKIIWTWVLTLPVSALIAACIYFVLSMFSAG
jgi:inorganic phosphate transporter, PiT family